MEKDQRSNHTKDEDEEKKDQSKRTIVNGVDIGWHKGTTFRDRLKQFHENFALQPDRSKVNAIQEILRPVLEHKLSQTSFRCGKIEYTGSSFEGSKVPKADDDPDIEFDMLFIIEGGDKLKKVVDMDPGVPGFVFLEPRDADKHHCFEKQFVQRSDNHGRTLSAAKFLSDFQSVLAECMKEIGDIRRVVTVKNLHTDYLIKLRRHGPAIQMDVYLNTMPTTAAAAAENKVACNDVVKDDAADDDNESCNGIDDKRKCGQEGENGESGFSKESGSCMDVIYKRSEDANESTVETGEEAARTPYEENANGFSQEVCFRFRLATKDVIGRKELSKLKPLYSVDVVPTLHVPSPDHNLEGEFYVAKPVKGHEDRAEELQSAWRRSFSLEAKNILKRADRNNTCIKTVFRILKAIRNHECGLHKMNTYHLKNALLKEYDCTKEDTDTQREVKWSMKLLAERFMDVLERLIMEYGPRQKMSEYFIKEIDLLEHMPEPTRENIHFRLKRLRNSEKQMMRTLEGKKPRKQRPGKQQKNKKKAQGHSAVI